MLPKSITKFVTLLLILAPPLLIGILIFRNGVDVPVLDEWDDTAPLFEKVADGSLGFGDFYAQHNEHRIFFPRLIFVALGRLTHWDIRAELWVIFFSPWSAFSISGKLRGEAAPLKKDDRKPLILTLSLWEK